MTRGRTAARPSEIPAKGLADVAVRIWHKQSSLNIGLVAAGIAFYGLLSLFPGITAAVAIAGMIMDPAVLVENSTQIAAVLPNAAQEIILGQLGEVAAANSRGLSFAAALAISLALYSASKAIANFIAGLNIIYDERETRSFVRLKLLTILLTVALIFGLLISVIVVAVIPTVAAFFAQIPVLTAGLLLLRWPVLFLLGAAGIAALYRYGPDRSRARWRWLTPGAFLACALWVGGSIGFSYYVQSFGTYNETFGALAGVIVLLTWLWLSAYIVLMGGLLDAELEAQTKMDSTVGPEQPMGDRGAVKADTLGPAIGAQKAAEPG